MPFYPTMYMFVQNSKKIIHSDFEITKVRDCLEGNTISNRGAYSTKERMPSDMEHSMFLSAWKAVPNLFSYMTFRDVLPSRQQEDY